MIKTHAQVYGLSFRSADETDHQNPAIVISFDERLWPEVVKHLNKWLESLNFTEIVKMFIKRDFSTPYAQIDLPSDNRFGHGGVCTGALVGGNVDIEVQITDKDHCDHAVLMLAYIFAALHKQADVATRLSNQPQDLYVGFDFLYGEGTVFSFYHPSGFMTGKMIKWIRELEDPGAYSTEFPVEVREAMEEVWKKIGDSGTGRIRSEIRPYEGIRLGPRNFELDDDRHADEVRSRIPFAAGDHSMFAEHVLVSFAGLAKIYELAQK